MENSSHLNIYPWHPLIMSCMLTINFLPTILLLVCCHTIPESFRMLSVAVTAVAACTDVHSLSKALFSLEYPPVGCESTFLWRKKYPLVSSLMLPYGELQGLKFGSKTLMLYILHSHRNFSTSSLTEIQCTAQAA